MASSNAIVRHKQTTLTAAPSGVVLPECGLGMPHRTHFAICQGSIDWETFKSIANTSKFPSSYQFYTALEQCLLVDEQQTGYIGKCYRNNRIVYVYVKEKTLSNIKIALEDERQTATLEQLAYGYRKHLVPPLWLEDHYRQNLWGSDVIKVVKRLDASLGRRLCWKRMAMTTTIEQFLQANSLPTHQCDELSGMAFELVQSAIDPIWFVNMSVAAATMVMLRRYSWRSTSCAVFPAVDFYVEYCSAYRALIADFERWAGPRGGRVVSLKELRSLMSVNSPLPTGTFVRHHAVFDIPRIEFHFYSNDVELLAGDADSYAANDVFLFDPRSNCVTNVSKNLVRRCLLRLSELGQQFNLSGENANGMLRHIVMRFLQPYQSILMFYDNNQDHSPAKKPRLTLLR
eukprot:TRINITY_DN626_c0_g1_i1.p1 TRINITY_DN626_c0_g1~~TRINITY_DN626_c0_g1_i1.p1  ORF type:complete len:401 (+),score=39.07 TRINITY_DN626_c0_g1_i1:2591-3793(+)